MKLIEKYYKDIVFQIKWTLQMEENDKFELRRMGFWEGCNNDHFENVLSEDQLERAALILSKYYGLITAYATWDCKVTGMKRYVFGN